MCSAGIKTGIGLWLACMLMPAGTVQAQDYQSFRNRKKAAYERFASSKREEYNRRRKELNDRYMEFMRKTWYSYGMVPPVDVIEVEPIPLPVIEEGERPELELVEPVEVTYVDVVDWDTPDPRPRPEPVVPIPDDTGDGTEQTVWVYGTQCRVRMPDWKGLELESGDERSIRMFWGAMFEEPMNGMMTDCLDIRDERNLCDWAYLKLTEKVAEKAFRTRNAQRMLQAAILMWSGYQVRLACGEGQAYFLLASYDFVLDFPYFEVNGLKLYVPEKEVPQSLHILDAEYEGERRFNFILNRAQKLAWKDAKTVRRNSQRDPLLNVEVVVNQNLIDFYNDYPRATDGSDTKVEMLWRYYANAPFSEPVKRQLYPALKKAIGNRRGVEAVNVILHFMQNVLVYGYDSEIWGTDRPFFAEETLYYPYCDCEDRAILFSRLVRDLLGLDVVLLNLPGHLAAAVALEEPVNGYYYQLDGKRFYYCEPTVIGRADAGWIPDDCKDVTTVIIRLK